MEFLAQADYLVLGGILIIVGLYLRKWEPPIKRQFIALILLVLGMILGHFMIANMSVGFLMAGLVFYKDELVEEIKMVKDSFLDIGKDVDDLEESY